jgi:hypothetical protein
VYARVDLQASAFDSEIGGRGTTNVDFNEPMRTALGRLRDDEQVGLAVGRDGVELERRDEGDTLIEKRVRLPVRWVKGFSEVQAYQPGLTPFQTLDGGAARQFLRGLPRQASGALHLARSGKALRVTPVASRDTARAGGLQRLRVLEPLLSRIDSLRVWSDPASGTSGWEAGFANARLLAHRIVQRQIGGGGAGLVGVDEQDPALQRRPALGIGGDFFRPFVQGDEDLAARGAQRGPSARHHGLAQGGAASAHLIGRDQMSGVEHRADFRIQRIPGRRRHRHRGVDCNFDRR